MFFVFFYFHPWVYLHMWLMADFRKIQKAELVVVLTIIIIYRVTSYLLEEFQKVSSTVGTQSLLLFILLVR